MIYVDIYVDSTTSHPICMRLNLIKLPTNWLTLILYGIISNIIIKSGADLNI